MATLTGLPAPKGGASARTRRTHPLRRSRKQARARMLISHLPEDLVERLSAHCDRTGQSRSEVLAEALRCQLAEADEILLLDSSMSKPS